MDKWLAVFLLCTIIPLYLQQEKPGCNEAICASIVSKCMLTGSCKCDTKNATCKRDCFLCLDYLYPDCCVCVDMCPLPNHTDTDLGQKSHVEELSGPVPDLFIALTEEKDRLLRWTSFTFPSLVSIISTVNNKEIKFSTVPIDEEGLPLEGKLLNCTVAFLSQCMSFGKCKDVCRSMGASSCRWFHDGCCECIGSTCLNYGINEGRCLECPEEVEDDEKSEENEDVKETTENLEKTTVEYNDKSNEPPDKESDTEKETLQKVDS